MNTIELKIQTSESRNVTIDRSNFDSDVKQIVKQTAPTKTSASEKGGISTSPIHEGSPTIGFR
ncbi:hypothetical protein [Companilactobacillus paralimentarius]|uniref:hypothetical protein n=1 Tax=Companilactobacillus paralimentarius TaxID=83526 RepID=UPI00384C6EF7